MKYKSNWYSTGKPKYVVNEKAISQAASRFCKLRFQCELQTCIVYCNVH